VRHLLQRDALGIDNNGYLPVAVSSQLLQMLVPPLQVVLHSNFLDNPQGQQLRLVPGKGTLLEKFPGTHGDVVLEILHQGLVDAVLLEEHPASQVEIEKGHEGRVLHLEIHSLEDRALGLLILMLREGLLRVTLVPVEVGHVLIQLHSLARHDQGSGSPELLVAAEFMLTLVDVKTEGEGVAGKGEFIANGGEEQVGLVSDLARLYDFGS
jgi:hypothetical protein